VLDKIEGTDLDTGANLDVLTKLEPERQEAVVEHAETKGISNLKQAKKSLEKDEAIAKIQEEPAPLPDGPFRVIAADPPWPYDRVDDETHRGSVTYHTMTLEEIEAMEVEAMAHDDCALFLWTTNSFLHEAYHVVEAWGFEPKTLLTWDKGKIGVGNYLRNQTEHAVVAVRGKPVFNLTNQSTILRALPREHSRKPEQFYQMVEELCPGSKVELFAREEREGWSRWGSEPEKFSDKEA
jgi:N6-adenosine-specific RNA methylase IME4